MRRIFFKTNAESGKSSLRIVTLALCLLILSYAGGLVTFVSFLPKAVDSPQVKTDALIVLTGGSDRLNQGLDLLAKGMADKLFVSGVYHGVDVDELLSLAQERPDDLSCCITLGYEAEDTRSNALETADWVASEGVRSIRLITAVYHMPRSLLEFNKVMPDLQILAHPVFPERFKLEDWWRWPGSASLLFSEYNKFLAAKLRILIFQR